jgi:Uncharacterised nucleotidyltransferase
MTIEELFLATRQASNLDPADFSGLDFGRVRRVAISQHGMFPLVAQSVLSQWKELLEEKEREIWKEILRKAAVRGLESVALLRSILGKLQEVGIEAVFWKGPMQSWRLYGDPGLRQFADLDICVQAHEVLSATVVLRGMGFLPERVLSSAGERRLLRCDSEYPWQREDGWVVDLQWRVRAQPLWLDPEKTGAWGRTVLFAPGGDGYRVWGWADELLFLALHGAKHRWLAWEWVLSFAGTADLGSAEDWVLLRSLARRWGMERIVSLGLRVAEILVGRRSIWAWHEQVHSSVRIMADQIVAHVRRSLADEPKIIFRPHWSDYSKLSSRAVVGWSRLGQWLLGPSVYDLQAFPDAPIPLLYLLRPLRLGRKLGGL